MTHYDRNGMSGINYEEIIALAEDPDVTFDNAGRPPTGEEHALVDRVAERAFLECDPDTQARLVSQGSSAFAERLLSLLSDDDRSQILGDLSLNPPFGGVGGVV